MSGEVEKCPILHVRPKFDVFTLHKKYVKPTVTPLVIFLKTNVAIIKKMLFDILKIAYFIGIGFSP